jgi:serine/threonine protein kinase
MTLVCRLKWTGSAPLNSSQRMTKRLASSLQKSSDICLATHRQQTTRTRRSSANPDVSPELEEIINKALEKDRNLRYQSAGEMRADLQRLKRDTDSHKSAAVTESAPVSRNKRLQWVGVGTVSVIAAIVTALFLWQSRYSSVTSPRTIAVLPFQIPTQTPTFYDLPCQMKLRIR